MIDKDDMLHELHARMTADTFLVLFRGDQHAASRAPACACAPAHAGGLRGDAHRRSRDHHPPPAHVRACTASILPLSMTCQSLTMLHCAGPLPTIPSGPSGPSSHPRRMQTCCWRC